MSLTEPFVPIRSMTSSRPSRFNFNGSSVACLRNCALRRSVSLFCRFFDDFEKLGYLNWFGKISVRAGSHEALDLPRCGVGLVINNREVPVASLGLGLERPLPPG